MHKHRACATDFLHPAMGFRVIRLKESETCGSKSSYISKIVDGMKTLIVLAHSTVFKTIENIFVCI